MQAAQGLNRDAGETAQGHSPRRKDTMAQRTGRPAITPTAARYRPERPAPTTRRVGA